MVKVPGSNVQPLLNCLEDCNSPPEDKTDAYLRLAEDLAKEDKQFVEEVCSFSSRLISVLTRDILSQRVDLSQAALQAVGYCIYQDRIVSSLGEAEMSLVLQDLCNVIMRSTDKNSCTRAFWGISRQHLSTNVIIEKLPVILSTMEHALQTFESTTVENEAMEVIYRLISELPRENITLTAGQWTKLVYPLLISSAHKIREKALGILELGLEQILLARQVVVSQLLPDLKGGLLSELAKLFADNKEIFVLRTWTVLVTILGETLHKGGNFINEMLKIPEQGFKSPLPNVQNMSYSGWTCLIDNFAISPTYIGSQKKIKLLMMPLVLKSGNLHEDIELGRLQAWWHLVCVIKPETYATTTAFSEVCLPLLQYFFNVSVDSTAALHDQSKDSLREMTLPVTPISRGQANTPSSSKSGRTSRKKSVVFNKTKFPEDFVKQVVLLGFEMLVEILATNTDEVRKTKRLTEHLQSPVLNNILLQEHLPFFLAVVKSALRSVSDYAVNDDLAVSLWSNLVNWIVSLIQNGDPCSNDVVIASFFQTAHDILTGSWTSTLKFLEILTKFPVKYLLYPVTALSSHCSHTKPVFLLTDILFSQLSAFKETYVDERFHIVFENLIDVGFEAPSGKLTTVHNMWLVLEGLASTVANVEDLWRFWSKVTDSVTECVIETSDVNQGDSLEPDFSLMISLLSFPFRQLFTAGLPVITTRELDRDLAEFFRLFCRCSSLVPAAEANTCIEVLAKSLLTVVTQETCKNVKFLDSISSFISVMIDCVDFTAQNTRTSPSSNSRVNVTPGGKLRHFDNPLDNLSSLLVLSDKVLGDAYWIEKNSSGSVVVAPAVTVLAGSLSKVFANLTNPQQIKFAVAALSSSVCSFISHHHWSSSNADKRLTDKKCHNIKYLLKIEKLWTDILMCLQSRYTAAYDSQLLTIMSELLESTFCHQRRQFRNQTIMFWNATFGQASHLVYSDSLRVVLQTVMEKTPLTVPGWDQLQIKPVASLDELATLQDSEEMTPKENVIKQNAVVANSPKRKHGGSSPRKVKGSFLHKADRFSPLKSNLEIGNKRKSPGSANARRKLPLPLDTVDDKDFVVIAPSPKKKRLLTEHQKEVRKAKKLESGHPVFYNMLDQSQDGTQFSLWSQSSSMIQCFNHSDDVKISEETNLSEEVPLKNDGAIKELQSSVQPNIDILLDKNNNGLEEPAVSTILTGAGNLLNDSEYSEVCLEKVMATPKSQTLPGGTTCDVGEAFMLRGSCVASCNSVEPIDQLNKIDDDDDDDEPIPSSQNTPSTSSRQNRRSRIYHTPKNTRKQSLTREKSKNAELKNADVDKIDTESLVSAILTDRDESSLTHEEFSKNETSMSELVDPKKNESSEPIVEAKKTSPISSRTRFRRKPTPYKPKNTKPKRVESPKKQEATELNNSDMFTDSEEYSDHQMDDTQIIEPTVVQVPDKSSDNDVKETELPNERPSSPVPSSSIKFVKTTATGSPLNRPHRAFSSPACSPTTGILKRNRGKSETPSPPGKIRHVSFAFPLKEEKEISVYPLDQGNHKKGSKHSDELTNNFTSIKETSTKSTPPTSKEDCMFPDLIECTTPVEQILPSLATSRFSRGLGIVVHAQNIKTVGNLSALTKDQVEKLPIRSPKVSTLRRVLRNFHENRAPKNPKVNQLRAIKEVSEESAENAVNELPALADKEAICDDTEEHPENKVLERNDQEPMVEVATPSSSVIDDAKMLTPKRSRALVKPTTLFESDTETGDVVQNATGKFETKEILFELSEDTEEYDMEEKQEYVGEVCINKDSIESERPSETAVHEMTEEQTSALNQNGDELASVVASEAFSQHQEIAPCVKMDIEENESEMTEHEMADVRETEKQESEKMAKPENQEVSVNLIVETKEQQNSNHQILTEDVPAAKELKENQEIFIDDVAELKQEIQEISCEYVHGLENEEIPIGCVPMAENPKHESRETSVENITENETSVNQEAPVEEIVINEVTTDPYVKIINNLLTLKSQQELAELPLDLLLSCQEQLMTILSNTTTAIRLKCEQSRK